MGMRLLKDPISVQEGKSWNLSLPSVKQQPDRQVLPAVPPVAIAHRTGPGDSTGRGDRSAFPLQPGLPLLRAQYNSDIGRRAPA